jgi:hypothetical protein
VRRCRASDVAAGGADERGSRTARSHLQRWGLSLCTGWDTEGPSEPRLNAALARALTAESVRQRFADLGVEPTPGTPEEAAKTSANSSPTRISCELKCSARRAKQRMNSEDARPEAGPQAVLQEMIDGYRVSQLIYVAAELGIADLLAAGPKHFEALARETASDAPALYRLLRALASVGVLVQTGNHFALNPIADCLRTDSTGSLRAPGHGSPARRRIRPGRGSAKRSGRARRCSTGCIA